MGGVLMDSILLALSSERAEIHVSNERPTKYVLVHCMLSNVSQVFELWMVWNHHFNSSESLPKVFQKCVTFSENIYFIYFPVIMIANALSAHWIINLAQEIYFNWFVSTEYILTAPIPNRNHATAGNLISLMQIKLRPAMVCQMGFLLRKRSKTFCRYLIYENSTVKKKQNFSGCSDKVTRSTPPNL